MQAAEFVSAAIDRLTNTVDGVAVQDWAMICLGFRV